MPWVTPTLKQVRQFTRSNVLSALGGSAMIANNVVRVISDAMAGLAHLTLLYIDWLSKQLMPDTAETEWLDRHGQIWIVNADDTLGRKGATFAAGSVTVTGYGGSVLPKGSRLSGTIQGFEYETVEEITIEQGAETPVLIRALDAGVNGNVDAGTSISLTSPPAGIDGAATVVSLTGGTDEETDDQLRMRVLERIREPPMGGDKEDYVQWQLKVPGVTRAWSFPLEQGIGTVTVRFMMDDLRAGDFSTYTDNLNNVRGIGDGYPTDGDITTVNTYLDTVRPVAVKDFFCEPPLPFLYNLTISNLESDDADVRAAIEASIRKMEIERVIPGQTMWRSWIDEAISIAAEEEHHDLSVSASTVTAAGDVPMPSAGYMARLGTITFA